jgi:hypothetical protein
LAIPHSTGLAALSARRLFLWIRSRSRSIKRKAQHRQRPPGAPVISDPVDLNVAPLSNVTVSLILPDQTPLTTIHWEGVQTAYISPEGNFVGDADIKADSTIKARLFLSGIMVDASPNARALVAFGDSITDGATSTPDANHRWPDVLARRLVQAGGAPIAVLNEGISGAHNLCIKLRVNPGLFY